MNFFKFLFSKTFLIQLILALVITVLLVLGGLAWLNSYTHHGEKIRVPDLSKMQLDSVQIKLNKLDLNYVVIDSVSYNPDYPKFSVVEQNPKPGHFVKENRKIYLKLNPSGFPKIEMPDFYRDTKREIVPALRAMGLKVGEITYKSDIAENAVLEMYVEGRRVRAGDKVMKNKAVDLVLGSGDPNSDIPISQRASMEQQQTADSIDAKDVVNDVLQN